MSATSTEGAIVAQPPAYGGWGQQGMPPGFSGQPGMQGMPPQGAPVQPGPQKKKKRWIPLLILGFVVLLGGGGGAVACSVLGGLPGVGSEELSGEIAWKQGQENATAQRGPGTPQPVDSAVADGVVLQVLVDKIVAYNAADGAKLWEKAPERVPGVPPQAQMTYCSVSSTSANGAVAVAWGAGVPDRSVLGQVESMCTGVQLLDVRTGAAKSPQTMLPFGPQDTPDLGDDVQVEIVGGNVVATHKTRLQAFSLANGQPTWSVLPQPFCSFTDTKVSPQALAAEEQCERTKKIRAFDPNSGSERGNYPLPADFGQVFSIVSASPLVIETDPTKGARLIFLDDSAKEKAVIPAEGPQGDLGQRVAASSEGAKQRDDYHVVAGHGMLVMPTMPSGTRRPTNELVAVDPNTGQVKWKQSLGPDVLARVITSTEDGFIGVTSGNADTPPKVVKLAAADGAVTPLSKPYPVNQINAIADYDLHWAGDALYGVSMAGGENYVVALR